MESERAREQAASAPTTSSATILYGMYMYSFDCARAQFETDTGVHNTVAIILLVSVQARGVQSAADSVNFFLLTLANQIAEPLHKQCFIGALAAS